MSQAQIFTFRHGLGLVLMVSLTGCAGFEMPKFGKKTEGTETQETLSDSSVKLIERDVEAPDVFDVTDAALWDGRPSLGGVWVAYADTQDPERVIIRNTENNKFVIGALFKRERDNPGPKIQLSSDAAAALGILAGKPTSISVTALRRETVPEKPAGPVVEVAAGSDPAKIKETKLDPIAAASAAIDKVESKKAATAPVEVENVTKPAATPVKKASGLNKPFIQIGIFSVEANADNTATSLRTEGVIPIVKEQESKGKKFWRVLVGPATSASERGVLLKKAQGLGFVDAYFVTN